MLDLFIPTFGRHQKLREFNRHVHENTEIDHRVWFLVEPIDGDSIDECERWGLNYVVNQGSTHGYAASINSAYLLIHPTWFFCGGDDLNFHKGWDKVLFDAVTANSDKFVFGTNDLLNKDVLALRHATHYLVSDKYIDRYGGTPDLGRGVVFFPYTHNYVDTEFIEVAKARGVFMPCLDSIVEHIHYGNKKAEFDATYQNNQSTVMLDLETFKRRRHLWQQ